MAGLEAGARVCCTWLDQHAESTAGALALVFGVASVSAWEIGPIGGWWRCWSGAHESQEGGRAGSSDRVGTGEGEAPSRVRKGTARRAPDGWRGAAVAGNSGAAAAGRGRLLFGLAQRGPSTRDWGLILGPEATLHAQVGAGGTEIRYLRACERA